MNINKTTSLIEELEGAPPASTPLAHPVHRVLPWVGFVLLYMGSVAFFVTGFRDDLEIKLQDTLFLFETGLTLMLAISALLASAWLCVPDMRGQKWILSVPLTFLSVFAFWYTVLLIQGTEAYEFRPGFGACTGDGILFGSLPVLALIFLTRKGATTRPYLMGFMNTLAVGALGLTMLRFTCGGDAALHIAFYHFLPFIVLGILLGMLARRIYHW